MSTSPRAQLPYMVLTGKNLWALTRQTWIIMGALGWLKTGCRMLLRRATGQTAVSHWKK